MQGYGNRGMTFESLIEYANFQYKAAGKAIIQKIHTHFVPIRNGSGKIVTCKVEEKATVDFMGRFGDRPVAFEAKHCSEDRIALKRVEPHQGDFLHKWTYEGSGIGFVLVSFRLEDFYLIPWECWEISQKSRERRMPATIWSGFSKPTEWSPTGKASIRKDELPEEWRVKSGPIALDYLATAIRVWGEIFDQCEN